MGIGRILIPAALAATAVPAGAAVTVLGSSAARLCFEAADAHLAPSRESLARCDEALGQDNLSDYDTVATYVNRGILRLRAGDGDLAIFIETNLTLISRSVSTPNLETWSSWNL